MPYPATLRGAALTAALLATPTASPARAEPVRTPALTLSGYGDLLFAFHDHGANQNREGGAQRDARVELDTTRFVLELEGELTHGIEIEAEIEIEHGGTGSALELEYEEFGEFEHEVEQGGAVILEELYLKRRFGSYLAVAVGRFYVALGLLSRGYRPTDYLAATRAESEGTVLPAVWDELGVQVEARRGRVHGIVQVVNGLDSTGFGSQRWIAGGHQRRFEVVRATDLAAVARVDVDTGAGLVLGASGYAGGTSRNRPKPDLVPECPGGDPDVVAPCGYVTAPVVIVDVHAQLRRGPLRGSALLLWGHLGNAAAVSSRNERLSNALDVPRTPVADQALAAWAELGVDVAPWIGLDRAHQLEPFVRVDRLDTMFRPRAELFDNPRFERTIVTAGVGWTLGQEVVLKLEGAHRRFGARHLAAETSVRLALGFVY